MLTTATTSVKKMMNRTGFEFSCPTFSSTIPTSKSFGVKNMFYNKGILAIHVSTPLIVVINFYI